MGVPQSCSITHSPYPQQACFEILDASNNLVTQLSNKLRMPQWIIGMYSGRYLHCEMLRLRVGALSIINTHYETFHRSRASDENPSNSGANPRMTAWDRQPSKYSGLLTLVCDRDWIKHHHPVRSIYAFLRSRPLFLAHLGICYTGLFWLIIDQASGLTLIFHKSAVHQTSATDKYGMPQHHARTTVSTTAKNGPSRPVRDVEQRKQRN